MLVKSKVLILLNENATQPCTVFLDGLNFLNSCWHLFYVNLNMINCHTSFSMLDVRYSTNVTVENSIFGVWMFTNVQQIVIKNCKNYIVTESLVSIDQDSIASLSFSNSSGLIENITIKDLSLNKTYHGLLILVEYYSHIQITNSIITNNTMNYGSITVFKSSLVH